MMEESAVKVCVRVRPHIHRELSTSGSVDALPVHYWNAEKHAIHHVEESTTTKTFNFDRVFAADESTNQLYEEIAKPLVVSTVQGYNGTIFAYGQTSSGKTFTMMGSGCMPGVIPLAMEDVFQTIRNCPKKEFLLRVSYMEIYNETVTDLLCDIKKRKPLEIREGNYKNVYVADLTEELVTSADQALAWIRRGEKNRHYGKTKMNERSSRSHTIFRMILESRERGDQDSGENVDSAIIVSHLNLVDLAGAERASQTGAEGTRLKEGCNINRSLFTLGQVIKKLSEDSQGSFINYRDSKLTRILQNSLGGNAKTVIVCTVTPAVVDETLSTLQFASAAKRMKNDPHVTEVSDDGALLRRYRNEIVDLKRRLEEVSSITRTAEMEKEVLAQLLQEKDQLQREQEDRIKNLTKIIVTPSNFSLEQKMPKRRATWGGKIMKIAQFEGLRQEHSETNLKRRKADLSVFSDLDEEGMEFDSRLEFLEEPMSDAEMTQSYITVRGSSDCSYPTHDVLSERVNSLEQQLKASEQENQFSLKAREALERRLAELEAEVLQSRAEREALELKVSDQGKHLDAEAGDFEHKEKLKDMVLFSEKEALLAKSCTLEQHISTMQHERDHLEEENKVLKQDKENLQREVSEKKELAEFMSLEQECIKQSEIHLMAEISRLQTSVAHSHTSMQKSEAEAVRLSVELQKKVVEITELQQLSGSDLVQQVAQLQRSLKDSETLSRDTKKDWAVLRSDNIALKERDTKLTLSCEKLQKEVQELHNQQEVHKTRYKKMEMDLQRELQAAFDENTKLSALLDGKIPKSLIISVELERKVGELNKEICELKAERTLVKQEHLAKIQHMDEELQLVLGERDSLVCERKCWAQSVEELERLRSLVISITEERDQLQEILQGLKEERNQLKSELQENVERVITLREEMRQNGLSEDAQIKERITKLEEELEVVKTERCQLKNDLQENVEMMIENQEELREAHEKIKQQQKLLNDLESQQLTSSTDNDVKHLQDQIQQMNEELHLVLGERDSLVCERSCWAQSVEELERLRSLVISITEERDQVQEILQGLKEERNQLKSELQENVEIHFQVIHLKEQLSQQQHSNETSQARLQELGQQAEELQVLRAEMIQWKQESTEKSARMHSQLQEELKLQQQLNHDLATKGLEKVAGLEKEIQQMDEELQLVLSERNSLVSERTCWAQSVEELERLRSLVISITEERDQLQEILQGLKEERNQLKSELQENVEIIITLRKKMRQNDLSEDAHAQNKERLTKLEEELEVVKTERGQLKNDLQENVEMMLENQEELREAHEKIKEQQKLLNDLESQQLTSSTDNDVKHLQDQIQQMNEELQLVLDERDLLLSERTCWAQSVEELERLRSLVISITEERDQVQEILQGLKDERNQLKSELQENIEIVITLREEIRQNGLSEDAQIKERLTKLEEELKVVKTERCQLKNDLQENVEMMIENQEELREAHEKIKEQQKLLNDLESQQLTSSTDNDVKHLQDQIQQMNEELHLVLGERDSLVCERTCWAQSVEELERLRSLVISITEERDQVQEILQGLKEERNQLKSELQENVEIHFQVIHLKEQLSQQQHSNETSQARLQELGQQAEELQVLRAEMIQWKQESTEKSARMHSQLQEELTLQQQLNHDLATKGLEKVAGLEKEIQQMDEELKLVLSERNSLVSERTCWAQSVEELERLRSLVISITEERDQLQEILQGLKEERNQLKSELQENAQKFMELQEERKCQQIESEEAQAELRQQVQSLSEQLDGERKERTDLHSQLDETSYKLMEAQKTQISAEHLRLEQQKRLQKSEEELQVLTEKLRVFWNPEAFRGVSKSLNDVSLREYSVIFPVLKAVPQSIRKIYVGYSSASDDINGIVSGRARLYAYTAKVHLQLLEAQTQHDVACLQQKQLLHLRHTPAHAHHLQHFQQVWEQHVKELCEKTDSYVQRLRAVVPQLEEAVKHNIAAVTEESVEHQRNLCELQSLSDVSQIQNVLQRELERRSQLAENMKNAYRHEFKIFCQLDEQLQSFKVHAQCELEELQKHNVFQLQNRTCSNSHTHPGVQKRDQQLLCESQQQLQALKMEMKDAQENKASVELQVALQAETSHILQEQLQPSQVQKAVPPSAAELESVKTQLFRMELEKVALTSSHQEEVSTLTAQLEFKEEALRKLKETLRKVQNEGDESFVSVPLCVSGVKAGRVVESSAQIDRCRMEKELKELHQEVENLESLVAKQKDDIAKWKGRALRLKENARELQSRSKLHSPHATTKRDQTQPLESLNQDTDSDVSDAEVKMLTMSSESPKMSSQSPEHGASKSVDKAAEWWPLSPTHAENCQYQ